MLIRASFTGLDDMRQGIATSVQTIDTEVTAMVQSHLHAIENWADDGGEQFRQISDALHRVLDSSQQLLAALGVTVGQTNEEMQAAVSTSVNRLNAVI
jgi:uncharacterized protein YukE